MGNKMRTVEELTTLFCQFEWVLSSRPVGDLSEDPKDPKQLTLARVLKLKLKLSKSNSYFPTFRFQTQIQIKLHYFVKLKPNLKFTKKVQTV